MIKNILEVITLNKLKLCIMFILTLIVSIGTVYVVYARVDIVDSVIYKTGSLWTKGYCTQKIGQNIQLFLFSILNFKVSKFYYF